MDIDDPEQDKDIPEEIPTCILTPASHADSKKYKFVFENDDQDPGEDSSSFSLQPYKPKRKRTEPTEEFAGSLCCSLHLHQSYTILYEIVDASAMYWEARAVEQSIRKQGGKIRKVTPTDPTSIEEFFAILREIMEALDEYLDDMAQRTRPEFSLPPPAKKPKKAED